MSETTATELRRRIDSSSVTVGIIGLGYVGLPLADAYLSAGFHVIDFDTDVAKIGKLERGENYIKHSSASTAPIWRETGRFQATSDMRHLTEPDAILICVPTPLTESRDPDLQIRRGIVLAGR